MSDTEHGTSHSKESNGGPELKESQAELDNDGRVIVTPSIGTNILVNSWTVWFMHRGPGVKISNYLLATKQVDSFSTVEEFWKVYSHLKRVDRLPFTSEFQVFRKGVKPMWEDLVNVNGGKWVVRFRRPFKSPPAISQVANSPMGEFGLKSEDDLNNSTLGDSDLSKSTILGGKSVSSQARNQARLYWEKLLLSIIGGSLAIDAQVGSDEIVGMVMSVRRDEDILSVWTRSRGEFGEGNLNIRDRIRALLELPESVLFEFKVHTDSIKEGEQKHAFYNSSMANSASTSNNGSGNRAFESNHFTHNHNNHGHHNSNNNNGHHNHGYSNNNSYNNHHNSSNTHHHISSNNNNNNHNQGQTNASHGFSRRTHFSHGAPGNKTNSSTKTVDSPAW